MEKIITLAGTVVLSFACILFLSFLLSWPIMMLWNGCLVDAVTGINEITWLQGWGLSILFSLLFNRPASK